MNNYIVERHYNYGDLDDVTFWIYKGTEEQLRLKMWKTLGLSDDADLYEITNYGNKIQFAPTTNDIWGVVITAQPIDTIEERK